MLKFDKICVGEHTATEQEKIFKTLANCMLFTAVNHRNHTLRINIVTNPQDVMAICPFNTGKAISH